MAVIENEAPCLLAEGLVSPSSAVEVELLTAAA